MNGETEHDVVVVGAGVVGCAIARELSQFRLRCALIEAGPDIGVGTSKANTALLHSGFDAPTGSLESRLVRRGHELLGAYASTVGIPIEPLGAVLVAWNDDQLSQFPEIVERAHSNGYDAVSELSVAELYAREPNLGPGARGALEVPDEGIICPFTTPLTFATEAVLWGCELRRESPVLAIGRDRDSWVLRTPRADLRTRFVVNAAGLHSDEIDRMIGHDRFTVTPRLGELIVFDKLARGLIGRIILAVPTPTSKGVLASPTVFGNVMVGPTAVDVERKDDTSSTRAGLDYILSEARRILPALTAHEITAVYAGLRAATEHTDYQIDAYTDEGYVCVGGIRSTGLTASMAIAEHVREQLKTAGLALDPKSEREAVSMPNIGERFPRPFADPEAIARDREYGEIVCFCERVTRGEIRDALRSPVPPCDIDGLRRRTRALMGRCQGFFCGAHITALMNELSSPR